MSYVRFTSQEEVVSASTDSTLRMWDVKGLSPKRTYDGHVNEKNFVGLSVDSDFLACGSETNEVCAGMPCLSLQHRLGLMRQCQPAFACMDHSSSSTCGACQLTFWSS